MSYVIFSIILILLMLYIAARVLFAALVKSGYPCENHLVPVMIVCALTVPMCIALGIQTYKIGISPLFIAGIDAILFIAIIIMRVYINSKSFELTEADVRKLIRSELGITTYLIKPVQVSQDPKCPCYEFPSGRRKITVSYVTLYDKIFICLSVYYKNCDMSVQQLFYSDSELQYAPEATELMRANIFREKLLEGQYKDIFSKHKDWDTYYAQLVKDYGEAVLEYYT